MAVNTIPTKHILAVKETSTDYNLPYLCRKVVIKVVFELRASNQTLYHVFLYFPATPCHIKGGFGMSEPRQAFQ